MTPPTPLTENVAIIYPLLSLEQQQNLPKLNKATPLPSLFEDSTHQLWQCDTDAGELFLKVCDKKAVQKSLFWQGMASLFAVNLPQQLGEFDQVYRQLTALSPLAIPDYIAASSAIDDAPAFILTRKIIGEPIDALVIDNEMVKGLAKHISQLHAHKQHQWGRLQAAKFTAKQWSQQLGETIVLLAKQQNIAKPLLADALKQVVDITAEEFVPIMLDLRWDQFFQDNRKLVALVDLDAIVYAPRALELVLLEYLLDPQQAEEFKQQYGENHIMPDLSAVRTAYRLLLFLMNVLGEQDVARWMTAPDYW